MISQTAEYLLRAVVCLAACPGQPQVTLDIAAAAQVPAGYLSKILRILGRAGIVRAQRGISGGFVLQRDPAQVTLLELVRLVDRSGRITECPLGLHGHQLCSLHRQLDHAAALVETALAAVTIADLLAGPEGMPLEPCTCQVALPAKPTLARSRSKRRVVLPQAQSPRRAAL